MLCPFLFSRIVSRKHFPPRNHIYKQPGLLDTHLAGIIQCLCLAEGGAPQLEVGLQTPSTTSVYIYSNRLALRILIIVFFSNRSISYMIFPG